MFNGVIEVRCIFPTTLTLTYAWVTLTLVSLIFALDNVSHKNDVNGILLFLTFMTLDLQMVRDMEKPRKCATF